MANEITTLMTMRLTPEVESFFRAAATTMKLRGVDDATINFPLNSNIPSLRLSFAEPQDDEETKPV